MSWVTWLPKSRMRTRSVMGDGPFGLGAALSMLARPGASEHRVRLKSQDASSTSRAISPLKKPTRRCSTQRSCRWLLRLCRRSPLHDRDEEAVGVVPGGGEAEHAAVGGARGAYRLRPDLGDRHELEIGVALEEPLDLQLVLLGKQRAGDVDEPAT